MRRAFGPLAALFAPALSFAQPVPPLLGDLTTLSAVPSETEVLPSAQVGLTYSVQNVGPGPTGATDVCLWLMSSPDGVGIGQTPGDPIGALAPGQTTQLARTFTAPAAPGLYVGRVEADCSLSVFETDESNNNATFTLRVLEDRLHLVTAALPDGFVNRRYVAQLEASSPAPPVQFSARLIPPALSMEPSGVLSGVPTRAGVFPVEVTVSDQSGAVITGGYTLTVHEEGGPIIGSNLLLPGVVGQEYCQPGRVTLEASGGSPPYRWNARSDLLPPGLMLAEDGSLCGVPNVPGITAFPVEVSDTAGRSDRRSLTLQILLDPLRLDTPKLPAGKVGEPYVAQLRARGGKEPYRFERDGNLPLGVQLRSDGGFFGTPEVAGTFTLSLVVTDALGNADKAMATIVIAAAGAAQGKILETAEPAGCGCSSAGEGPGWPAALLFGLVVFGRWRRRSGS